MLPCSPAESGERVLLTSWLPIFLTVSIGDLSIVDSVSFIIFPARKKYFLLLEVFMI